MSITIFILSLMNLCDVSQVLLNSLCLLILHMHFKLHFVSSYSMTVKSVVLAVACILVVLVVFVVEFV